MALQVECVTSRIALVLALPTQKRCTTTEYGCCPGWEQTFVPVFQPGLPFRDKRLRALVPGGTTGKKEDFISRSRFPTGTKEIEKIKKKTFLLVLLAVLRLDHHSSPTSTPYKMLQLHYKDATLRRNFGLKLDKYSSQVTIKYEFVSYTNKKAESTNLIQNI